MSWLRRARHRLADRKNRQEGFAAVLVGAVFASGLMFSCAAFSVDVSRWYLEENRVQKAADAAALAGVPYLPYDFAGAQTRALAVAKQNGYDDASSSVVVSVTLGSLASQLVVTISSTIPNAFGGLIGVPNETVSRSATADYKGPAPMGSPCNTFGNEPDPGSGAATPTGTAQGSPTFANCSRTPQLWATIEGQETGKLQGDRYQTKTCTLPGDNTPVDNCSGSNTEYDPFGYIFVVKVQAAAVGTPIKLQLYDPEMANTKSGSNGNGDCSLLPTSTTTNFPGTGAMNPYATWADAKNRYSADGASFGTYCTGDSYPGGVANTTPHPLTTSFVLRQQIDSQDPKNAPVQNDTGGTPCIKQYGTYTTGYSQSSGFTQISPNVFNSANGSYNASLSQLFHNWVDFCTFTPPRAGDYYLQVRTNVSSSTTSTSLVQSGNTAAAAATGNTTSGEGANSFSIRAVTNAGLQQQVAVSGYNHMAIYVNATSANATFNLIRVLPGAAGQYIQFTYFDAGDAAATSSGPTVIGSVTVTRPSDATGSITTTPFPGGCKAIGASAGSTLVTLSNCQAPINKQTVGGVTTAVNNGKNETITIPIPNDYNCNYASLGGCWYQVTEAFNNGTAVHDTTTWDATIIGDPVRLIK